MAASCFVLASLARWPQNLFLYHPVLAAAAAPLATAATISVRSRVKAARNAPRDEARGILQSRIQIHFVLSMVTTAALVGSVGTIAVNKNRLGRAHLVSAHARCGITALVLWLSALFVAETKVWADGLWKNGRLHYAPRWLWASKSHRQLGTAAYGAVLLAIASGVAWTPYGRQLAVRPAILTSLALTAAAMLL